MDKLLENLMGITETKIYVIDALIKLAHSQHGRVSIGDLQYMKSEIIKQSGREEVNDALNLMEASPTE